MNGVDKCKGTIKSWKGINISEQVFDFSLLKGVNRPCNGQTVWENVCVMFVSDFVSQENSFFGM